MKKFTFTLTLTLTLFSILSFAQVGIGTTAPASKLTIDASADTFPSLEIVPRITAPVGTASGQMAIIDNSIYIYDLTRTKWLSSETMVFPFGRNGNTNNQPLGYANAQNINSGAKLLFDATIVGITAQSAGGNPTKSFNILISGTTVSTITMAGNTFSDAITNINVAAGQFISVDAVNSSDVNNPTVTVYLKWRK